MPTLLLPQIPEPLPQIHEPLSQNLALYLRSNSLHYLFSLITCFFLQQEVPYHIYAGFPAHHQGQQEVAFIYIAVYHLPTLEALSELQI